MKKEEVIKWLMIMKANLNSFPEINCGNKIKALAEAIRLLKNDESEEPSGSKKPNKSENPTSSDCVDRHAVDMLAYRYLKEHTDNHMAFYEDFLDLPSVVPIRPKGRWTWVFDETPSTPNSPYEVNYAGWVCSCCNKFPDDICEWDDPDEPPTYKFCPNCSARMNEEEE